MTENIEGSFVDSQNPYSIQGKWLQVLITSDILPNIIESFRELDTNDPSKLKVPIILDFPEKNIRFIINKLR